MSPNPAFNRTRRQAASFLGERQWRRVPVNLGVTRESMSRDIRAFAVGVALFVALYAIYWLALAVGVNDERLGLAVAGLGYAVPLVAGGATAYLAGSHQFAALLALGVVGAASIGVINFVASALGASSDFPGAASIPLVAALSLFVQVPLVLVGGAIVGLWLRSRHA